MKNMTETTKMIFAGVMMAVGMFLPFLTGQIPQIGSMLSPMHLPVLICGFICGWKYGLAVGLILPLLRSVTFGMPPLMPTAAAMAVEMAVYGTVTGLAYEKLPKTTVSLYISLVLAMLLGRMAWGLVSVPLYGIAGKSFGIQMFLTGAFIKAVPAIIIQLLFVPGVVLLLLRERRSELSRSVH